MKMYLTQNKICTTYDEGWENTMEINYLYSGSRVRLSQVGKPKFLWDWGKNFDSRLREAYILTSTLMSVCSGEAVIV